METQLLYRKDVVLKINSIDLIYSLIGQIIICVAKSILEWVLKFIYSIYSKHTLNNFYSTSARNSLFS